MSDVSVMHLGMYSGTYQSASRPLLMEIFDFLDHSFCLQETIWMSPKTKVISCMFYRLNGGLKGHRLRAHVKETVPEVAGSLATGRNRKGAKAVR